MTDTQPPPDDEQSSTDIVLAGDALPTMADANAALTAFYDDFEKRIGVLAASLAQHHSGNKHVLAHTGKVNQAAIKALKALEDSISTTMIDTCDIAFGGEWVDGVWVEIHRSGNKKRTDNPMITSKIKSKLQVDLAVDPDTGEVDARASQAVSQTVDHMLKLTGSATEGFNKWGKRYAKTLDIDINKYETSEGGRLKVTLI